jgi:hypothetical protein
MLRVFEPPKCNFPRYLRVRCNLRTKSSKAKVEDPGTGNPGTRWPCENFLTDLPVQVQR